MKTNRSSRSNQPTNTARSRITHHASRSPVSRRTALAMSAAAAAGVLLAPALLAADGKRRVVVWSEGTANVDEASKKIIPMTSTRRSRKV